MYEFKTDVKYSGDKNKKEVEDVTIDCVKNIDYHVEYNINLDNDKNSVVVIERGLSRFDANEIASQVEDGLNENKSFYEIWEDLDDKYCQEGLTMFVGENEENLEIAIVKEDNVELEYNNLF